MAAVKSGISTFAEHAERILWIGTAARSGEDFRAGVDGVRPGVGHFEIKTMFEVAGEISLQAVIDRIAAIGAGANSTTGWIEADAFNAGVEFLIQEQMFATGSYIGNCSQEITRKLLLDIEIPLVCHGADEVGINNGNRGARVERRRNSRDQAERSTGSAPGGRRRECAAQGVGRGACYVIEDVGEETIVEDAAACANNGLPVTWVPGEAHAWTPIIQVLLLFEDSIDRVREHGGPVHRRKAKGIKRGGKVLITNAVIQSEGGQDFPSVLNVIGLGGLREVKIRGAELLASAACGTGKVIQEVGQAGASG